MAGRITKKEADLQLMLVHEQLLYPITPEYLLLRLIKHLGIGG